MRTLVRRAGRAARDPRRAAREAAVLVDLLQFRKAHGPALRRARPRRTGAGTALLIGMTDFVYQLKLEGLLAKALQLDGYRPVILTLRNARWAEPYYRAFGLGEFVYPEGAPEDEREARDAAARVLAGEVSVQSLKELRFRGAHVGQQTLSSLSRRFEKGRLSLDEPRARAALAEILPEAMAAVLGAERLLDRLRPDVVLFNERGYAGFGSFYDAALARGANVVQWVHAGIHWGDALMLKRYTAETRRLHPTSLSRESWETVRAMPWTERHERELREEFDLRYGPDAKHPDAGLQEGKRLKPPDEVRAQLALDPAKKTAVVFSHVLWDANMFFGDDLFDDQATWLVETVRAAVENPRVNWVVKLHPANLFKSESTLLDDERAIREALGELPPHVRLMRPETDVNTYSLFAVTDYGITIRGTVGMELPCFGIPVLTAGTGRYSGLGFTVDSSSAGEYLDRLRRIGELPPLTDEQTLLGKRHAYALFRLRPFRFSSYDSEFASGARAKHPLNPNLRLKLRTARQVEEAEDLRRFAEWALDPTRLDYLASV